MVMECNIDALAAYKQNLMFRSTWGLLNAKALQRMRYATRILRYTSNDNEFSHKLSSIE